MRLLWLNFCIYVFMLLFSFSIFSDPWSLKIENENNNTKTLDCRGLIQGTGVQVYIETNPGWLELPLAKNNFHSSKGVRATEVLL